MSETNDSYRQGWMDGLAEAIHKFNNTNGDDFERFGINEITGILDNLRDFQSASAARYDRLEAISTYPDTIQQR